MRYVVRLALRPAQLMFVLCTIGATDTVHLPTLAELMKNGLYTIHIEMLDGVSGRNGGVMVLRDGIIRGGDSHFYYTGSYTFADGKWKGELINNEHTPTAGTRPVFGGREVGIGFAGTYTDEGAEGLATALAGKRSIRFRAVMRLLVET